MGKIRVKSFGDQELEEKEKRRSAKRAEQKAEKKRSEAESASGGIKSEDISSQQAEQIQKQADSAQGFVEPKKEEKKVQKKRKPAKEGFRSQKYKEKLALIDRTKEYPLTDAVKLLNEVHMAKFDETVEIHVNTNTTGISGNLTLPHGSGKKTRVAIATDELISEIEKGKISFDVLLAEPQMMGKLAKVAKVLGPRGLMPNPKNGTISQNPQEVAKKFEGGLMNFKTETKAPIIHMVVGKMSFGEDKLAENITIALNAVKKTNIRDVTLKSSMSPGIKIRA